MTGKLILDSALLAAVNVGSSKLPKEVIKTSTALLSSLSDTKHALPDLPYDYNGLEPVISAETMTLHHSKHRKYFILLSEC
jgi:Fe-Mn family superoxide dismutase